MLGHQAKNFPSETNCRPTAKKRHHQSICDKLREMKDEERTDSHPKPDDPSKVTTATSYGGERKRNCVILQTWDLMKPGSVLFHFKFCLIREVNNPMRLKTCTVN